MGLCNRFVHCKKQETKNGAPVWLCDAPSTNAQMHNHMNMHLNNARDKLKAKIQIHDWEIVKSYPIVYLSSLKTFFEYFIDKYKRYNQNFVWKDLNESKWYKYQ